jgi:hypothetical protein
MLLVKPAAGGAAAFEIEAQGANGHSCSLDGDIRDGRATLPTPVGSCVVTFAAVPEGIRVGSVAPGPCRDFCGARATFEQMYLRPAPGCAPSKVKAQRDTFKRRYDARQFAEARDVLAPMLERCARTLGFFEIEWVRNDLALTLHRLKDDAGCRQVLTPLAALAKETDADIRERFPPTDAESMLAIAQATRTNLKLCAAGK